VSPVQDHPERFEEDLLDDDVWGEEAGEPIANPIVQSDRHGFAGAFKFGHLFWHVASIALMILAGTVLHDFAFLISLSCGVGLLALDGARARLFGWTIWAAAVLAAYYGIAALHPTPVPWWGMPALIVTIVFLADTLFRVGRMRLVRQRLRPPLNLSSD